MDQHTTASYRSSDRKDVAVIGRWTHCEGCRYLGEVTVFANGKMMRFPHNTVMTSDGLSGYATPEYLARHASKFVGR